MADPAARRLCIYIECMDVFPAGAEFFQTAVGERGGISILV